MAIILAIAFEEILNVRTRLGDYFAELFFWFLVALTWKLLPVLWNPYAIAKRKLAFLAKRSAVEKKKQERMA